MVIKHGGKKIPVKFLTESELHEEGGAQLEQGQFLFGMYKARNQEILLNKETRDQFTTFVHELGEYISNEYQQETPHQEMSVFTKVIADILEQNWNGIAKTFKLGGNHGN